MAKGNRSSKMGWFGWSIISVIIVTLAGSSLFFFNIFGLSIPSLFSDNPSTEANGKPISEETRDEVERVQETVGKDNPEAGKFISKTHDFYNETTGYGAIAALDWDQQQERANKILKVLEEMIPKVNSEALKNDLKRIQELAQKVTHEKTTDDVRYLHRMFHDLDIALNNYNGYDKIWHVTKTLKSAN